MTTRTVTPVATTHTVTVVVPTKDDPRLSSCLDALRRLELPEGWRCEVVVVDNGSADDPGVMVAAHPGVRLLREPAGGSYAARNHGVAATTGEVVAFTDSDCVPEPDWLLVALAVLGDDEVVAVAGDVRLDLPHARPRGFAGCWESVEAFPQAEYVGRGFGVTANLVVRRSAGDLVGWFDAGAFSGGDVGFGLALTGRGMRLVHAPAAVVVHPPRAGLGAVLRKGRRVARGEVRLRLRAGQGLPGLLRWLLQQVRVLLGCVRRAVRDPRLQGATERLRYLAVAVVYRAVVVFEIVTAWPAERHRLRVPPG